MRGRTLKRAEEPEPPDQNQPHLSEGVLQLLDADHVCCLRQEFRAHQLHEILKVNVSTDCRQRGSAFPAANTRDGAEVCVDALTVHVDLLAQLDQLHFRGHVSHRSHAVAQIFAADEPVFVFVKLLECIPQLWWTFRHTNTHPGQDKTLLSVTDVCVCSWNMSCWNVIVLFLSVWPIFHST